MSENGQAKKKYLCQHVVVAEPMTLGEWEKRTGHTWNEPDRPRTDAGYKCDYPDGYSGWCPKDAFEKVSRLCETYLDRLMIEERDLYERVQKLGKALQAHGAHSWTLEAGDLMHLQYKLMTAYLDVLEVRIGYARGQIKIADERPRCMPS